MLLFTRIFKKNQSRSRSIDKSIKLGGSCFLLNLNLEQIRSNHEALLTSCRTLKPSGACSNVQSYQYLQPYSLSLLIHYSLLLSFTTSFTTLYLSFSSMSISTSISHSAPHLLILPYMLPSLLLQLSLQPLRCHISAAGHRLVQSFPIH